MTIPVEEADPFVALFDRLTATDLVQMAATPPGEVVAAAEHIVRSQSDYDWPEPDDFPELVDAPGHFGPEGFEDMDDAIAFIEEEGAEGYAEAYQWDDGCWYIYYFDES